MDTTAPPPSLLRRAAPWLVALAAVLPYLNSLDAPFVFDDHDAIVANPHLRGLWPPSRHLEAPLHTAFEGRPVVSLSFALNHFLDGLKVRSYHATNVAIHAAATLALYGVLRRLFAIRRAPTAVSACAEPLALASAALWAAHPLHTESVTYLSTRTESLMGMWALVSLYAFLRWRGSGSFRWAAASAAACALALASKETAVVLPILVLLLDASCLSDRPAEALRKRWRMHAALAAGWAVTLALAIPKIGRAGDVAGWGLGSLSFADNLLAQCGVALRYLRLSLWPDTLVVDYCDWPVPAGLRECYGQALACASIVAATFWTLRRAPLAGFALAWTLLTLAPPSLIPQPFEIAAERRTYLPLAALVPLAAASAWAAAERLGAAFPPLAPRLPNALACAAAAAALALGVRTWTRNLDYADEERLLAGAVRLRPDNPRARHNLAVLLSHRSRLEEAIGHLERVIAIEPRYANAYNSLGSTLAELGRIEEALPRFREAAERDPGLLLPRLNYAATLAELGRAEEAAAAYRETLRAFPGSREAAGRLAWILATHPDESVRNGAEALSLATAICRAGASPLDLDTLAAALAETGDLPGAADLARRAAEAASAQGNARLSRALRERERAYRAGRPWRDPPPKR